VSNGVSKGCQEAPGESAAALHHGGAHQVAAHHNDADGLGTIHARSDYPDVPASRVAWIMLRRGVARRLGRLRAHSNTVQET